MRYKLLILFYALVSLIIVLNEDKIHHNQFSSDRCGYYLYLPAVVIYKDLKTLSFYPALDSTYQYTLGVQYSLYDIGGNKLDKYPAGVALFEFPFFCIAHAYARFSQVYQADGFSIPYQIAGIASNIFWVLLGLLILGNFLKRYFSDNTVTVTLLCIAFGTNLYVYTNFDIGMSHPYSFFLFSAVLNLTDLLYTNQGKPGASKSNYILLGITFGLICIVRPVNIIAGIIPAFWNVSGWPSFVKKIKALRYSYLNMLMAFFAFIAVIFIQLAYWKYITGHWVYYSYEKEGFNFGHPYIFKGLFSYRKGWFIYTPMALVCLVGLSILWKKNKKWAPALALFFAVFIYVVFSWSQWWYGGSFGCRPLIESLAFLSLPLAATIEFFNQNKPTYKKTIFYIGISAILALNIFQTYQYSMGLIHWSRMTPAYYWRVFGKIDFDRKKNEKYLIDERQEFVP